VQEVLYVAQQDMQLAASTAFLQILQDKLVPLQAYSQTFLQTILTSVDSKDSGTPLSLLSATIVISVISINAISIISSSSSFSLSLLLLLLYDYHHRCCRH
jgi:hypothetical protein